MPYKPYEPKIADGKPLMSYAELKPIISSLYNKYEFELNRLESMSNNGGDGGSIEERLQSRREVVQDLSITIALDFSTLAKYKLETGANGYCSAMIDSALGYLRDVRQSLSLFISSEKL